MSSNIKEAMCETLMRLQVFIPPELSALSCRLTTLLNIFFCLIDGPLVKGRTCCAFKIKM